MMTPETNQTIAAPKTSISVLGSASKISGRTAVSLKTDFPKSKCSTRFLR